MHLCLGQVLPFGNEFSSPGLEPGYASAIYGEREAFQQRDEGAWDHMWEGLVPTPEVKVWVSSCPQRLKYKSHKRVDR